MQTIEERRAYERERMRRQREKWRDEGICLRCGVKPVAVEEGEPLTICDACRERMREMRPHPKRAKRESLAGWSALTETVSAVDRRRQTRTKPEPGSFGAMVRHHRDALGISQSSLARRMSWDHSYVSRIERGERHPERVSTLLALAEALELGTAQTVALFRAAAGMEAAA